MPLSVGFPYLGLAHKSPVPVPSPGLRTASKVKIVLIVLLLVVMLVATHVLVIVWWERLAEATPSRRPPSSAEAGVVRPGDTVVV